MQDDESLYSRGHRNQRPRVRSRRARIRRLLLLFEPRKQSSNGVCNDTAAALPAIPGIESSISPCARIPRVLSRNTIVLLAI